MREQIKKWVFYPESPFRLALILSLPLIIVLALLIVNMVKWEKKSLEDIQTANMKEFARAFFNHIVSTNIWSQSHGGIYVEITQHPRQEKRPPPLSVMGKDFVKLDPAIVTRQIAELMEKRSAYRFHVTSLKPASPEGRPDQWETAALLDFEQGAIEASTIAVIRNKRYFRYMSPLTIDEKCLSCHQTKGDTITDIMGGLSIDIPLEATDRLFAAQVKRSSVSFATFGIFTMISIIALTSFFSKRISDAFREKTRQQEVLKKLNDRLSLLSARDQKILGSIVDGIAIISEDGFVENINESFSKLTKIGVDAIKGKHISDFANHTVLKGIFGPMPESVLSLHNRTLILTNVPVASERGDKFLCSLRILHDATDERLSAAIELAGATAHEVRQPLAIVISMSDLVREKISQGKDVSEEIAVFEQQCKRINDIVSRMLNITRYRTKPYTEDTSIFDL